MTTFRLIPFPGEAVEDLAIHGEASLGPDGLAVTFRMEGPLEKLVIPPLASTPARLDNLWQTTCLELFISKEGSPDYLEANLSPAGHWNLYAFSGYRDGMRREETILSVAIRCLRTPSQLHLFSLLPLPGLANDTGRLLLGVSAILLHQDGRTSHWALAHPGPKPDFHTQKGFLLRL